MGAKRESRGAGHGGRLIVPLRFLIMMSIRSLVVEDLLTELVLLLIQEITLFLGEESVVLQDEPGLLALDFSYLGTDFIGLSRLDQSLVQAMFQSFLEPFGTLIDLVDQGMVGLN